VNCKVSYVDPITRQLISIEVKKSLIIGRNPGENGLVVGENDDYVSSIALEISLERSNLVIWNRSSHNELDIRLHTGLRMLFPNEKIVVRESATIIIPSAVYMHKIEVDLFDVKPIAKTSTGTQRLDGHDLGFAMERIPTLCGLCVSYFYPERYGSAPLTANQIAEKLQKFEPGLTPKAVNNKIQRTREQVEDATGAYLNDREGLALFLIRKGHITKEMVDRYF
jgi:hypothetical protein